MSEIKRYIVVIAPEGEDVESYDFSSSGPEDVALRRGRIQALARWGDPENFEVIGCREIRVDANEQDVNDVVQAICEAY